MNIFSSLREGTSGIGVEDVFRSAADGICGCTYTYAQGRSRSPNVAQGPSGSIKVDPLWHVCGRSHLIIAVGSISAILRRLRLVFFGAFGEDCGWSYLINSKTGAVSPIWQILDMAFGPTWWRLRFLIILSILRQSWLVFFDQFETIAVGPVWSILKRLRLSPFDHIWDDSGWSYPINHDAVTVGPM